MKKILTIILALCLCLLPLSGCSNNLGSTKLNGVQNTDYVVLNNGGSAVQYGNYMYFVNGYRGYDDTDGKNNVWGNVTKGALYRVELNGVKNGTNFDIWSDNGKYGFYGLGGGNDYYTGLYLKNYVPYVVDSNGDNRYLNENDNEKFKELIDKESVVLEVEKTVKDDEGNDTDETETEEETFTMDNLLYEVGNVDRFAPKTIGTSGYSKGGIFIFDDFVYYASPNNERNKTGSIQTSLTDFFATSVDGSKTYKLYTTSSTATSSPYAFYKYGDSVYLTVLDGTDLVSVRTINGKEKSTTKIAEKITSAVMPVNKVYDSANHNENDVLEYVYTTRAATEDDREYVGSDSGTVIEYMRPDGSNRNIFLAETETCSIEAVADGLVYYRVTNPNTSKVSLHYTNMPDITEEKNFSGVILSDVSPYTSFYFHNSKSAYDDNDNRVHSESDIFVLAKASAGLYVIDASGERIQISKTSGDVIGVYDNMVYMKSGSNIIRCNIAVPAGDGTDETVLESISTSGLLPSVFNGMIVYFGKYNDSISDYARIHFIESGVNQFVGEIAKTDLDKE